MQTQTDFCILVAPNLLAKGEREKDLTIRDGVSLEPLIHGASHESGRRAGTENVLLNVALGAACDLARTWRGMDSVRELRDLFWELLQDKFGDRVILNGHPLERLPNTLNVSFVA